MNSLCTDEGVGFINMAEVRDKVQTEVKLLPIIFETKYIYEIYELHDCTID